MRRDISTSGQQLAQTLWRSAHRPECFARAWNGFCRCVYFGFCETGGSAISFWKRGRARADAEWDRDRELVLPEEAERYWKIAPAAESEKVVAFSAS